MQDNCDDLLGIKPKQRTFTPKSNYPAHVDATAEVMQKLDKRETYFVDLMVNGMTCEQAAERAGYSAAEAFNIGRILYERTYIKDALKWKQLEWLRRVGITRERILQEYAKIAFFDYANLLDKDGKALPLHKIPEHTRGALSAFDVVQTDFGGVSTVTTTKVKTFKKMEALDALARVLELLVDKVELSGPGGKPIEVNTTLSMSDTDKARRVAFLMTSALQKQREVIEHE